jgi:hypothetical protein
VAALGLQLAGRRCVASIYWLAVVSRHAQCVHLLTGRSSARHWRCGLPGRLKLARILPIGVPMFATAGRAACDPDRLALSAAVAVVRRCGRDGRDRAADRQDDHRWAAARPDPGGVVITPGLARRSPAAT